MDWAERLIERVGRTAAIAITAAAFVLIPALFAVLTPHGRGAEPASSATTGLAVAVPVEAAQEGAVSVTALEPVWIKIYRPDEVLFMGELATGQSYELPAQVDDAMLWTGRPHAVEVRLAEELLPVLGPPQHPMKDIPLGRAALRARIPALPPLPPVKG